MHYLVVISKDDSTGNSKNFGKILSIGEGWLLFRNRENTI